ncbi:MAG: radical SAM protein, partial [Verrucomicrobiota bacterium]
LYRIDSFQENGEVVRMSKHYKYLFGPVPSRRLGRSLGVDLIPFKTCTMNCRFCQLGDSDHALSKRSEYVPVADVLAELEHWRAADGRADHITLAGSGEPTLHSRFGDVFRWVKDSTDISSVLLTNGSLMHLPEVRADAALADKVKVTLSAWDEASFQQIHHPAQGVTFEKLVQGERAFRKEFSGELSVEVFIVEGINSQVFNARKIAAIVESINPDRIDLNTAVRPPADSGVNPTSPEQLAELAKIFGPKASVTASFKKQDSPAMEVSAEVLFGLIKRHPATCAQLAKEFSQPEEDVSEILEAMIGEGKLSAESRDGETYYFCRD